MGLLILEAVAVPGVQAPAIVLSPEGGLQMEWHRRGWDVEIEARASGDIEAWAKDHRDGQTIWAETLIDVKQFVDALRETGQDRG